MTSSTLDRPGTAQPDPLPPLFAVRAEVEQATNVDAFDKWVEVALARTDRTGDVARFHRELLGWLRTALVGLHQAEVLAAPYEERDELIGRLVAEWLEQHPSRTNFA
jgi:cytochrome b561